MEKICNHFHLNGRFYIDLMGNLPNRLDARKSGLFFFVLVESSSLANSIFPLSETIRYTVPFEQHNSLNLTHFLDALPSLFLVLSVA